MSSLTGTGWPNLSRETKFLGANRSSGLLWRLSTLNQDETGEPVSRDQILKREQGIRLSVENKHADGGRDGRTCLARPNSQALTGIQDECGE